MRNHLVTLLDDFRAHPNAIAVVRYLGNRRRVTTYGELARLAGRFAALLAQRGIVSGDRVLLWAENSAEWIAAFTDACCAACSPFRSMRTEPPNLQNAWPPT